MKLYDPTSREKTKQYDESDIEHLVRVRPWKNYDEIIAWLEQEGDNDNELTPGETAHLIEDFKRLKERKAPFTLDPDKLCHELRG